MIRRSASLGVLLLVGAASGCASSEAPPPSPLETHVVTAEEEQAFRDYLERQQPGAQHHALEPLIGHFQAQVLHWMAPGQEPASSTGTLDNSWALGGRFVLSQFHGDAAEQPYEGMGLLGYDTVRERYVGNWADTMGTFLWPISSGDLDSGRNTLSMSRVMNDPLSGDLVLIRELTTIEDADHITYEMFVTHPGTDEYKTLEVHYVRT